MAMVLHVGDDPCHCDPDGMGTGPAGPEDEDTARLDALYHHWRFGGGDNRTACQPESRQTGASGSGIQ